MAPMRLMLKLAIAREKWANRWGEERLLAFESSRTKIAAIIKGGIKSFTPGKDHRPLN